MCKNKSVVTCIIMLLFILTIILTLFVPNINKYGNSGKLYINEVMAGNSNTIQDKYGKYSDYIEIYNDYDYDIDLSNYYLSDNYFNAKKWSFPKVIIKKNSYLVVFATGKNNNEKQEIHTNFKLSKSGETITLSDKSGKRLSRVHYSETSNDTSYGYNGKEYVYYYEGTPGKENDGNYSFAPISETTNISSDNLKSKNVENELIINEVSLKNEEIEIKNTTDEEIELINYYIIDKNGNKANLPNVVIEPNGYFVIYGSDNYSYINSKLYIGFHLNNHSEKLFLYKDDIKVDEFNVGKLTTDVSVGINDDGKRVYYKEKTIGSKNGDSYYLGYTSVPVFNINGGYVEKGTKVEIDVPDNVTIYYTIDGSFPNSDSIKYENSIEINSTTIIKAVAYKDNYIESETISRTFVVGREHELPVISIQTENDKLFGSSGILTRGNNASSSYPYYGANFWSDEEVKASFELYEDGKLGISFVCGIKVFGGWSRGEAQKSMSINLRKEYGLSEFSYPLFDGNNNTFKKIVLRNGGQDFGKLKLKDAFFQEVLDGQMDIDKQDYKFVVVYINGEYFGIYNIREKTDTTYVERHYNVDKNDIDFIEKNDDVKSGSMDDWNDLINYVKTADMNSDEVYDYLDTQVDLQELANYWIVETFFDQFDPINIKRYKVKDGKWRWILFDLDQTFFSTSYTTVKFNLPFVPYAHGNNYYLDTTLMSYLRKNPKFRKLYIETFAYHLKTTFKPERMENILDSMVNEIKNEMPYHIDRWYAESVGVSSYTLRGIDDWYNNISYLKKQLNERYNITLRTIKDGLNLTEEEYNYYFSDV